MDIRKYTTLARIILTLGLLVGVWLYTHWSVALLLTFLCIGREDDTFRLEKLIRAFGQFFEREREFKRINELNERELKRINELNRVLEETLEKAREHVQQTKTNQGN
jgi:hypothetical protein